jgi:site-specific recombinase XerD
MSSIYKDAKSPFYQADIWIDGNKFSRSTRKTSRREAEAEADRIEQRLREELKVDTAAETSLRIDDVALRYMKDVGDHHAGEGASITDGKVARLVKYFGPDKLLTDITHDDVVQLVNWRRQHKVGNGKNAKPISPFTINDTTEQLKKLFTYLKARKVKFPDHAPNFGDEKLWLKEPKARPRALSPSEHTRLDQAMDTRPDAEPLILFSRITGKRKTECFTLEHAHVKWDRGIIERKGKGEAWITIKITPAIRAILWPLRNHHPKFVFTYIAQRNMTVKRKDGTTERLVKDKRYPYTKDGLRRIWNNIREEAGLPMTGADRFRWHDQRHDFAINFLRDNPSAHGMKMLQVALDHADFGTTANTYADVHTEEVADAVEARGQALLKSRKIRNKNHRNDRRSKVTRIA